MISNGLVHFQGWIPISYGRREHQQIGKLKSRCNTTSLEFDLVSRRPQEGPDVSLASHKSLSANQMQPS